jgi:hypothetical protein
VCQASLRYIAKLYVGRDGGEGGRERERERERLPSLQKVRTQMPAV